MREVDAYPEMIREFGRFLETDIKAYLKTDLEFYKGIDSDQHFPIWIRDLSTLKSREGSIGIANYLDSISRRADGVRPDLFWLVWKPDVKKGCLLFVEVKIKKNIPSLSDLSQLIGYCLVTQCEFGLLVNIDGPVSAEWENMTWTHKHLFSLKYLVDEEYSLHRELLLGVLKWSSSTRRFDFSQPKIGLLDCSRTIANLISTKLATER